MMALKMLYRGPSTRLENLIEKIQATKEIGNNDIYSTHTSSSYSPSISDGTITPNSLSATGHHHHSHLHHPAPHHLQHHLQLHGLHHAHYLPEEERQQQQRYGGGKTNGNAGTATDGEGLEMASTGGGAGSGAHLKVEGKVSSAAAAAAAAVLAVEQLKRHGRHHHLRGPSKLRKIDRASARALGEALKFDKTTGDGISGGGGGGGSITNSDGSYQCQFCDKSFPRLGYLKKHEQSHAEHLPFKCDYCARLFKHKRSRDRHTKLHTGDRRYRCPHCESAFSRSDHLKIHMKTHDNQKPFQCTICNRGYNTAAALTSHMQNHKKQAAILAAGGHPQALNYSPRSNGSGSSGGSGSLHKRRYALAVAAAAAASAAASAASSDGGTNSSTATRLDYHTHAQAHAHPHHHHHQAKRVRVSSALSCAHCTRSDFATPEQLHSHIQATHEKELAPPPNAHTPTSADASASAGPSPTPGAGAGPEGGALAFQLTCEYCSLKLPNIPAMFQHMRSAHVDRLSSPNSYFEHFNRLAASGTFSPRLVGSAGASKQAAGGVAGPRSGHGSPTSVGALNIKLEEQAAVSAVVGTTASTSASPKSDTRQPTAEEQEEEEEEEPTDLSRGGGKQRRSHTPEAQASPQHYHNNNNNNNKGGRDQGLPSAGAAAPGLFFCNQCNAGLPDFDSFRQHLKTHLAQGGAPLVCQHCGLALRDHAEYERHVIAHFLIANTEYACSAEGCKKAYGKQEELQKHLLDQHVATVYRCLACAEHFETKMAIQVHFACAHINETKLLRCSACMETFRSEADFTAHVKARHHPGGGGGLNGLGGSSGASAQATTTGNPLQCMFCRTVCSSELEMHFHLAAHARQFRCPSCPETFHVEFLLDRHMESQHGGGGGGGGGERQGNSLGVIKEGAFEDQATAAVSASALPCPDMSSMNSLYVNALFSKAAGGGPLMPGGGGGVPQNNNSSLLDYNVAFAAAHLNKGLFPASTAAAAAGKYYSPLQVDTSAMKHPALVYAGLSQRYFDTNRALIDMYAQHQQDKVNAAAAAAAQVAAVQAAATASAASNYFISPPAQQQQQQQASKSMTSSHTGHAQELARRTPNERPPTSSPRSVVGATSPGFSCDVCERNDFRTETEVHSHRKIVHNMKTGVSLRCAYCAGNFKSRSELEHHMKTCHNSTGKHKCLICDEIFPSPAILAEHKLQHSKVGQSGKCSHCSRPLDNAGEFKAHLAEHNGEGQLPVQCVCCRQSLHSDFEIGLHAKFHTKAPASQPESVCALCLLEPVPATNGEAKVCEKCCRKHNLNTKYAKQQQQQHQQQMQQQQQQQQSSREAAYVAGGGPNGGGGQNGPGGTSSSTTSSELMRSSAGAHYYDETRCNLCKMTLPHASKLQEHLVEHTFAGCEERGYTCYICSAVFTAPGSLLLHMAVHGANARPYDCNLCSEKYFFRAELDHHVIEHELREPTRAINEAGSQGREGERDCDREERKNALDIKPIERPTKRSEAGSITTSTNPLDSLAQQRVKEEILEGQDKSSEQHQADEEEYIEVEQLVAESTSGAGGEQRKEATQAPSRPGTETEAAEEPPGEERRRSREESADGELSNLD